ncbi:arginine-tRNA-protein transferase [Flammeovirga sp. SubArs3]|uniref:arginine-tRNA-protein transferase n=1 Tax=Flammeovirga sp. SubArs3 TaxID=2995316 RepID=UPI00248ABD4A|nr:arginine-tRNA-protein transferase [Flammeovirga sp. SubArs3]
MSIILEEFTKSWVSPSQYDYLLENGWRHFGENFFRYNINIYNNEICNVLPLRVRIENFHLTKSQRKILRRNKNFNYKIQKVTIDEEAEQLFSIHKEKFVDNVPNSIFDFLSEKNPTNVPTSVYEIRITDQEKTIAISYFAIGAEAISSIYGMFHPDYAKYSLGILTMLLEIKFTKSNNLLFYYHGYCYDVPSFYDYKKKFSNLEYYQWDNNKWEPYLVEQGVNTMK